MEKRAFGTIDLGTKSNISKRLKIDLVLYTVCLRSLTPFLYSNLLYKMGQDVLDRQYVYVYLFEYDQAHDLLPQRCLYAVLKKPEYTYI